MHKKPQFPKPCILVVDDDQATCFLTTEALKREGHDVVVGANGDDAVRLFKQKNPDLILLDVEMPVKNGFDALQEIRQLDEGADVPIIMITGLDDTISVDKAYEIGATDFITKPINWSILGHRIRYILRANHTFRNLKHSESSLANAQRIAKIGNWEWDIQTDELYWSPEIYQIFGLPSEVDSSTAKAFMRIIKREDTMHLKMALERAKKGDHTFSYERKIMCFDEQERTFIMRGELTTDNDNEALHISGTVQDITERREAEDRILHLAYYDALTGLPNRQLFQESLTKTLQAENHDNKLAALLFIDLDRFKQINDSLGHSFGDELIKIVATRIHSYLRKSDLLSRNHTNADCDIARIGGDEFIALLTHLENKNDAKTIADRLIEKISEPINIDGKEIVITASIGIAFSPDDGDDFIDLLKNADTAVNATKEQGRNGSLLYTSAMSKQSEQKLTLENELRKAIKNNELVVHFQPQIDTATEKVIGAEALVRWVHPEKGFIPPDAFIGLAEETGLILPLGKWVLNEACHQAKKWQQSGLENIRISVNVSSKQFLCDGFLDDVKEALITSKLEPQLLDLELTEGALMGNGADIISRLKAIKALGVTLSLDDFGTGFSSLSYLTRYPLDTLKIDRSFIMNIGLSDDEAIIKTIIGMAHSLHLNIISEGVETENQLAFLRQYDTRVIQGYLYSKPLIAEELTRFIAEFNLSNSNCDEAQSLKGCKPGIQQTSAAAQ